MEFNVFEYFKDYKPITDGPGTPEAQGDIVLPRRSDGKVRMFFGTASGFAATMLAVNKITGMQFFEVTEAEAADAKKIMISRKAGPDFIVDAHTHICTRKTTSPA
jgi:hypothetical protein